MCGSARTELPLPPPPWTWDNLFMGLAQTLGATPKPLQRDCAPLKGGQGRITPAQAEPLRTHSLEAGLQRLGWPLGPRLSRAFSGTPSSLGSCQTSFSGFPPASWICLPQLSSLPRLGWRDLQRHTRGSPPDDWVPQGTNSNVWRYWGLLLLGGGQVEARSATKHHTVHRSLRFEISEPRLRNAAQHSILEQSHALNSFLKNYQHPQNSSGPCQPQTQAVSNSAILYPQCVPLIFPPRSR